MREKNITLYERNVMRIIGGLLFDMSPNRQPRNAEIIMTKVRGTFREKAYNSNEFYMLVLKDNKDTCTQKCESSSTNCNLAINRINEKKN